jgi:hypothetical protein
MNATLSLSSATEAVVTGEPTGQFASSMVIDSLDEFAVGTFLCATSADYAIGL